MAEMSLDLESRLEFIPDGASTIVRVEVRLAIGYPWVEVSEFLVRTADQATMDAEAIAALEAWLERYGKVVLGHYLN